MKKITSNRKASYTIYLTVPLKTIKVIGNKENLRKWYSQEEPEET